MCKSGKSEKILNFLPTEGMGCLFRVYTNMGRLSSVRLSLCVCFVCVTIILCACVCFCVFFRRLRANLANWMGEDSYCRGSIVHTRFGCSRALFVPPKSPTALWRFRASTSNSLIGRTRLPPDTPIRQIIILTFNKIFKYVKMTILSRSRGSPRIPRRFDFFV